MADLSAATLFGVNGMVFVVSGGGSGELPSHRCQSIAKSDKGIGAMMAKALAVNGAAKVYILGRRLGKLEETAKVSIPTLTYVY